MTEELHRGYRAATEDAAHRRLDRDVLHVTGADAGDYLDRTLSNAVAEMEPTAVRRAMLLDEDGRTRALLDVLRGAEGYTVVAATDDATDLAAEWRDNVFIDDVAIEQRDEAVLTVQGPAARDRLTALGMGVPADRGVAPGADGGVGPTVWRRDRSPTGGYLLLTDDADELAGRLDDAEVPALDAAADDALRVAARVPSFDDDLAGRLPLGMGVDDTIGHDERCYVGQEVVARIHQRAGGPDRRLARLDAAAPVAAGSAVLDADGGAVGEITTAGEAPDRGPVALAVLDDDAPRRLRAAGGTALRRVDTAAGLAGGDEEADGRAEEASP